MDAISRYIYTALQGANIMHGWTNDNQIMIACCSDGSRPVVYKIERLDYKVIYIDGVKCEGCEAENKTALMDLSNVLDVVFRHDQIAKSGENFSEVFLNLAPNCEQASNNEISDE